MLKERKKMHIPNQAQPHQHPAQPEIASGGSAAAFDTIVRGTLFKSAFYSRAGPRVLISLTDKMFDFTLPICTLCYSQQELVAASFIFHIVHSFDPDEMKLGQMAHSKSGHRPFNNVHRHAAIMIPAACQKKNTLSGVISS